MSAEENKALVRRFTEEVYNRGNLDVADELLAPDFVDHDVFPGEEAGIEGYKRGVAKQRASSSDLHFSIEEQIAEGDKVLSRVIGSGTLDQKYRGSAPIGLAPTGARITIENITISRVVEGKIVEERNVAESTDSWQQLLAQERPPRSAPLPPARARSSLPISSNRFL
jgi:predicted ester cyclase